MDTGNNVVNLKVESSSPEDIIFWHEVRTGYDQVAINATRQILVARGTKQAKIYHNPKSNHVMIAISEIEPEQPILVKP
jgi:hypothetical protein